MSGQGNTANAALIEAARRRSELVLLGDTPRGALPGVLELAHDVHALLAALAAAEARAERLRQALERIEAGSIGLDRLSLADLHALAKAALAADRQDSDA